MYNQNTEIIQSPLYDPTVIVDYDDIKSPEPHQLQQEEPINNFVQKINTRKRIYGEEYKISTYLNVNPAINPKILKLDQPIFEIHSNATSYRTEGPPIAIPPPPPSSSPQSSLNLTKNKTIENMDCMCAGDKENNNDDDYNVGSNTIANNKNNNNEDDDDNNNNTGVDDDNGDDDDDDVKSLIIPIVEEYDNNDDDDDDDTSLLKNLKDFSSQFSVPIPSITKRPFINFTLNKNDIPKLCHRCFATCCSCKFLENKYYT